MPNDAQIDKLCEATEAYLEAKSDYESADQHTHYTLLETFLHAEQRLVTTMRIAKVQTVVISLAPLDESDFGPNAICLDGRAGVCLREDGGMIEVTSLYT